MPDAADEVAEHTPDTTAPTTTARPTVSDDAPGSGSGSAAPAVATTAANPPATATGSAKPEDFKAKAAACAELEVAKDWQGLRDCSGELASLGAKDKSSKDKAE